MLLVPFCRGYVFRMTMPVPSHSVDHIFYNNKSESIYSFSPKKVTLEVNGFTGNDQEKSTLNYRNDDSRPEKNMAVTLRTRS